MKMTINVNIGSRAFTMDEDAYKRLRQYYGAIETRLKAEERSEVVADIEERTADIFNEQVAFPAQVVNIGMVERTIAIIGTPDEFGYQRDGGGDEKEPSKLSKKRLMRSSSDKKIGGVCGGLAVYFNVDPTLIRIAVALLSLLSVGAGLIIYVAMWIIVPSSPERWQG